MSRVYSFGGLSSGVVSKSAHCYTIQFSEFKYVVKCSRELKAGYLKITVWIDQVRSVLTGNRVKYPDMSIDESQTWHLLHKMSEREMKIVMYEAEKYFKFVGE